VDKVRTFIVEDNPVLRDNLSATLVENAGVEIVGSADSERSALVWLLDGCHSCDVVLIDVFLKSGTGLGVLIGLKELPYKPQRVVVLSNYATPEMRRRCAELGADEVFDKSTEIEELLAWFRGLHLVH
jgi:DNA-binding NarL/FixJ family response regulator